MIVRDRSKVPYPRVERSASDRPIWDIGPFGHLAVMVSSIPMPSKWPDHWPDVDLLSSAELAELLNGDTVEIREVDR
jgi:hypothetical protein